MHFAPTADHSNVTCAAFLQRTGERFSIELVVAADENKRLIVAPIALRNEFGRVGDNPNGRRRKILQQLRAIFDDRDMHSTIDRKFGDRERAVTGSNKEERAAQILRL